MEKNKVLIIRFSSFGDIIQCSTVIESITLRYKNGLNNASELHWVTRSDFESIVRLNQNLDKVWTLNKKLGFFGLIKLSLELRNQNYSHIYDAHNNLRSKLLVLFLMTKFHRPSLITRSKFRVKRFLLFTLRINKFPKPFIGINSFLKPLGKWNISSASNSKLVKWKFSNEIDSKIDNLKTSLIGSSEMIVLVPSAAWEMKRWPVAHWSELIRLLPEKKFIILGGSEDLFCEDLANIDSTRVFNLAGRLTLVESCSLVSKASLVISADTGLLHVADVLGVKAISLMGPTAFGFTKSQNIKTIELDLACRPCSKDGRGSCSQKTYQLCMVNITPNYVAQAVSEFSS